jgi:hypothetical protein
MIKVDDSTAIRGLQALLDRVSNPAFIQTALVPFAEKIQEWSRPLVPYDTAELFNSYNWSRLANSDKLEVGFYAEYAMYQHEGMRKDGSYIIRNRPAGGQSKFLVLPIDQHKTDLQKMTKDKLFTMLETTMKRNGL